MNYTTWPPTTGTPKRRNAWAAAFRPARARPPAAAPRARAPGAARAASCTRQGGQLPFYRSLPFKRGFTNIRRIEFAEVNLDRLGDFAAGSEVDPQVLAEAGLVRGGDERPVALLGRGKSSRPSRSRCIAPARSAVAKVEAAGGKVEILE